MFSFIRKILKEEDGSVVVIVALAFTALLGFAALAIDIGVLTLEKTRLARTMDAAALAAAQELPDTSVAATVAFDYASRNHVDPSQIQVSFSNDKRKVTVTTQKTVPLYFAKALGFSASDVSSRASAKIVPVKSSKGLIPIGINDNQLPLFPGVEYMIKSGAHDQSHGWRGIIKYPGAHGASDYADYITNGYPGEVEIGEKEDEENGNVSGPTSTAVENLIMSCSDGCSWDNYKPGCPRVVLVPIYHDMAPEKKVEIRGYAAVFLERVAGSGDDSEVYARYVNSTISAEADDSATNYNTYLNTVRLSE